MRRRVWRDMAQAARWAAGAGIAAALAGGAVGTFALAHRGLLAVVPGQGAEAITPAEVMVAAGTVGAGVAVAALLVGTLMARSEARASAGGSCKGLRAGVDTSPMT